MYFFIYILFLSSEALVKAWSGIENQLKTAENEENIFIYTCRENSIQDTEVILGDLKAWKYSFTIVIFQTQ